jgi:hypothetical protein
MRRSLSAALAVVIVLAAGRALADPGTTKKGAARTRPATGAAHARPASPSAPLAHGAPAHQGTTRRPLTLAAQNIEGRAEGARVLFVHTGPKIALEDASKHPSYLRDDFTAALSSPVTVHVRNIEPLRTPTTPGGSR